MSVASLANRTIIVERATVTRDAMGGRTPTWATHLRLPARVQPLSAGEAIRSSREDARVTHRAYVPGTPDITTKDRIRVEGSTPSTSALYVQGVRDVDHAGVYLTIDLEERHDG